MKKTLLLLLMVQAIVFAQNPSKVEKLRITNNITSTTAPFVAVIENNGEVNKITKVDLIDVIFVNTASDFNTLIGNTTKLYVTRDGNKIYRFDGTIYRPLDETDISGKEDKTNKQNNLVADGTNLKYPTVTAINSEVVKLTGDQNIVGTKTFQVTENKEGIVLNNSFINTGLRINNNTSGTGAFITNNANGVGLQLNNFGGQKGMQIYNDAAGVGLTINTTGTSTGLVINTSNNPAERPFVYNQDLFTELASLDFNGKFHAAGFIKEGGLPTESLMADGSVSVISNGSTVNTAFTQKTFAASMSVAHDPANPNFYIDVTGNLNLSITGTSNKDSGIINLNFTGAQVVTLTSGINKVITGAGVPIQVFFIHDESGLKWYRDETGGAAVDTSLFALKRGTTLFHTFLNSYTATITNVGVDCTANFINSSYIGYELTKTNGEKAVVATVTGSTNFTTILPFATNSTSAVTSVSPAVTIGINGNIKLFSSDGGLVISSNANGSSVFNQLSFDTNGNATFNNFLTTISNIKFSGNALQIPSFGRIVGVNGNTDEVGLRRFSAGIWEVNNGTNGTLADMTMRRIMLNPSATYVNDAAADADTALLSGSLYFITGDRVPRKKP